MRGYNIRKSGSGEESAWKGGTVSGEDLADTLHSKRNVIVCEYHTGRQLTEGPRRKQDGAALVGPSPQAGLPLGHLDGLGGQPLGVDRGGDEVGLGGLAGQAQAAGLGGLEQPVLDPVPHGERHGAVVGALDLLDVEGAGTLV